MSFQRLLTSFVVASAAQVCMAAPTFPTDGGARASVADKTGSEVNTGAKSARVERATGGAYADLATGKVGAWAMAPGSPGNAGASLVEYAYFTSAAGQTHFLLPIHLEVSGILLPCQRVGGDQYCPQPNFSFGISDGVGWNANLSVGWRSPMGEIEHSPETANLITFYNDVFDKRHVRTGGWTITNQSTFEALVVVPFNRTIRFAMGIGGNGPFDFGHTAALSWDVPADVQVTTASGVFLTGAVPEPATLGLLLAGLFVVLRRQRGSNGR